MDAAATAPPAVPTQWARFLAFDYGQRRTGVASGNLLTRQATPRGSIHARGPARWAPIAQQVSDWQPDALVVGIPLHPDGAPHANTRHARHFAQELRARFGLPVFEVDERYSTTEARAAGAADLDATSAAIILEQFLRALP